MACSEIDICVSLWQRPFALAHTAAKGREGKPAPVASTAAAVTERRAGNLRKNLTAGPDLMQRYYYKCELGGR